MRGDRRSARLTALWAVLAVGAGIASVWVPVSRGALVPSILELTVGWTLLIASLLLARRTPTTAALFGLAGLTWIGVGLAPFAGTLGEQVLARLALVPTALIAIAAIVGPRRWPTGYRMILVALVSATAIVAGAGWYRFSILVIGLLTLASTVPGTGSTNSGSDRVRIGFGGGLIAVGAVAASANAASPQFVANLHDIVLIGATAAITLVARRERALSTTDGIELGEPSALAESLSAALGCGPLTIAFPSPAGTWLDPSGRTQTPRSPGGPVQSATGTTIAWLSPAVDLDLDPESAVTVRRILETASDTATLREGLRRRATEIDRSRERLQTAAEGEHARLIVLLESGPLAALARAGTLLTQTASGRSLSARVADAERVLTDVVRGLHPVEADGGLVEAIAKLTDRSHATLVIDPQVDLETGLGPTEREVVWFTCAEGLANAAKHAPGSAIVVRLETGPAGYVLTVSDDGPGGADAPGSGLSGLRERAGAVSGSLTVESTKDGTTLRLLVPAREEIACFHVAGTASAPIRTPIEFGTVGA